MLLDFRAHYCVPPFVAESTSQTSAGPPSSRAFNQPYTARALAHPARVGCIDFGSLRSTVTRVGETHRPQFEKPAPHASGEVRSVIHMC